MLVSVIGLSSTGQCNAILNRGGIAITEEYLINIRRTSIRKAYFTFETAR